MCSFLKVFLFARHNVFKVDGDEVVPVWPSVLMHEAQSVKQLMDWSHQTRIETGTATINVSLVLFAT